VGGAPWAVHSIFSTATPSVQLYGLWPADVNGDGRVDVVLSFASGVLQVMLGGNAQDSIFIQGANVTRETGSVFVTVADFNVDGVPDIASGWFYGTHHDLKIFLGVRSGSSVAFVDGGDYEFPEIDSPVSLRPADFNGDGLPDLAVAGGYSGDAVIFFNTLRAEKSPCTAGQYYAQQWLPPHCGTFLGCLACPAGSTSAAGAVKCSTASTGASGCAQLLLTTRDGAASITSDTNCACLVWH
jgi:hypothetical protein